ncbi:MAG: tRNA 2-thiouridine(34) synthase MnmA [Flavobacteriales bacterium]|jgi:tRNA-specific 2-thiouridylase|nr:tRNA 2-thiouridine(34) synthase MnmA [Flavobacteriales bacterium]|tara:strand:+ start:8816 stop:10012 length:1197 start_codon:yes stop_codon:yes gene_type:complete
MKNKRVIVGLSGGVDSSVAAHLLKKKGYEVIGLFMKNWHNEDVTISNECPWLEDSYDAVLVSQKLNIPFQTIDLSIEYKKRIVDYMFEEYSNGRTPNPDILCNREIKFDLFLEIALSLGADFIATGHYCQKRDEVINNTKVFKLLMGKDNNKDQSYFLCQLNQYQLNKTLFPIGHLNKSEVRKIAKSEGLITAEKKDSQGLCFIGKVRLPDFLKQKLKPIQGDVVQIPNSLKMYKRNSMEKSLSANYDFSLSSPYNYEINDGNKVGTHEGAHYYTIGQRKGLGIGGTKEPLFIIKTNIEQNIIYVGEGNSHPGLYREALRVLSSQVHWIREDLKLTLGQTLNVSARIRYRQPLFEATLFQKENHLYLFFKEPQSAVTPGQFVAWYLGNELVGSGTILE